jgi:hypothetical protein
MKNIFFDINFFSFITIIFLKDDAFLISDKKNFFLKILKKIKKKKFNIIKIDTSSIKIGNENIHFFVDKLTKKYTKQIFYKYLEETININKSQNSYLPEIKFLFLKYLYEHLLSIVLRIETANYIFGGKKIFYFNNIDCAIVKFLQLIYRCKIISLNLYKNDVLIIQLFIRTFIFNSLRKIFNLFYIKTTCFKKKNKKILINTENKISFNNNHRNDFFFIKKKTQKFIFNNNYFPINKNELKNNNCFCITNSFLLNLKSDYLLENDISQIFIKGVNINNTKKNFIGLLIRLVNIKFLMLKLYPFFSNYNINYVINVSYSSDTSVALEYLKKIFQFKTISYQYSFLRTANPIMSSISDYMIIFSNYFKKIFSKYSKPKKFIEGGYLYSSFINKYKKKIGYFKKKYNLKGKFVISFYDENCDNSIWSLTTTNEMAKEYESLANFVLDNKDIVVLIKTQFLKNFPTVLSKSLNLEKALKNKRLIEVCDVNINQLQKRGISLRKKRNNILPLMTALVSNITISKKYGATTSIESAIVNKRNIIINEKGYKEPCDKYYKKNIEFKNLDEALGQILVYKKNFNSKKNINNNLGNWDFLINKIFMLKTYKNFKFVNEMQNIMKD